MTWAKEMKPKRIVCLPLTQYLPQPSPLFFPSFFPPVVLTKLLILQPPLSAVSPHCEAPPPPPPSLSLHNFLQAPFLPRQGSVAHSHTHTCVSWGWGKRRRVRVGLGLGRRRRRGKTQKG